MSYYLFDQDNKDYLNQTIFFEKASVCTAQADKVAPPCDFSGALQSGRTVTTLILKRDYDLTMPACHYFINPSQCRSLCDQVSKKYF